LRMMVAPCLRVLIPFAFASRDSQPVNLSAGYFFKLRFPALSGLGDEEYDKTVPCFPEPIVCCTFDAPKVTEVKIG
jgi:hypothetical protein